MKPETMTGLSREGFLARTGEFLESAGRLMDLDLRLLNTDLKSICPACPGSHEHVPCPDPSEDCDALLGKHVQAALHNGGPQSWRDGQGSLWTAVPVFGPDRPVALLLARDATQTALCAERDLHRSDFLNRTARQLADELYLLRREEDLSIELSCRCDQLQVLYATAGRLVSPVDQVESLRALLGKLLNPLAADVAMLTIPGRRLFEVATSRGLKEPDVPLRRRWSRVMRRLEERVLGTGRSHFSGSPWDPSEQGQAPMDREAQALALRIDREGSPCGLLALLRLNNTEPFRSGDMRLVESLAEHVSLAIKNTELYEDLQAFLMSTVKSLVNAIEAKDPYTCGHSERVHLISMLLGRRMGLPPGEMENLRWASILHDVGKIGMPESVLCKASSLTREEYEIIKQHPERGYRLLQPIGQLAGAARVVRAHHERMDGRGYPDGLRGDAIPMAARIIAVADTYDAMTTTRPYRRAASTECAVEEIQRLEGTQFDIAVSRHFVRLAPFLRENRIMFHADSEIIVDEAA